MRKKVIFSIMLMSAFAVVMAQKQTLIQMPGEENQMKAGMTEIMEPEVTIVQPGSADRNAPSDAIVLFNGSDINSEWSDAQGNSSKWVVKNGELLCVKGSGIIKTKRKFDNFQLHIEWKAPSEVSGDGQGRGNSGVYLQEQCARHNHIESLAPT